MNERIYQYPIFQEMGALEPGEQNEVRIQGQKYPIKGSLTFTLTFNPPTNIPITDYWLQYVRSALPTDGSTSGHLLHPINYVSINFSASLVYVSQ